MEIPIIELNDLTYDTTRHVHVALSEGGSRLLWQKPMNQSPKIDLQGNSELIASVTAVHDAMPSE